MDPTEQATRAPEHPYAGANVLSRYFFWWLLKLLRLGLRRQIVPNDIYETLPVHRSAPIGATFERRWRPPATATNRPADAPAEAPWQLLRVLLQTYGTGVLLFGLLFGGIESSCRIVQPFLLGRLILYFDQQRSEVANEDSDAITLTAAYWYSVGIVLTVLLPLAVFHMYQLYLLQVGLKIRIGCCALIYRKILQLPTAVDGLSGTVINLMANDVSRFDYAVIFLHDLWKGPVELVIVSVLVYREIGPAGLIGIALLLLFIPVQAWLGKKAAGYRLRTAMATDERVKFTNEVLQGIQVVKMYVWERPFELLIQRLRSKEIQALRGSALVRSALFALRIVPKVSIFLTLVSYVYFGNALTARRVYMLTSFFSVVHHSMVEYWPLAVTSAAEGWVSLKRIQHFLLRPSLPARQTVASHGTGNASLQLRNVSASWPTTSFALRNINLRFRSGQTCAIIGAIGSGKSTLLNLVAGEMQPDDGEVIVGGNVSYCTQKPWIFEGTIRQNVVFVERYDEQRYRRVLQVCALERDLKLWPHGDQTMVGERGVSLSGGQKARVNLARAVYREADIYLLDDPLSAVDVHVGNLIFDQCIKEFLGSKLCILVTHQLQYVGQLENIVVLSDGAVVREGRYEEVAEFGGKLEQAIAQEETPELLDEPVNDAKDTDEKEQEGQQEGNVSFAVYRDFLKSVRSVSFVLFVALLMMASQAASTGSDYFVFVWVNWEEMYAGTGQTTWTTDDHVYLYAGAIFLAILLTSNAFAFFEMCLKASLNVHAALYRGVSQTAMHFFHQHSSGRIMNRFSKDIGLVDSSLPTVLIDSIYFFLELFGIVVIVSLANYWLLVPTAIMGIVFYVLRSIFLRTARNVKRIEAISRSPVFAHTNATVDGLATIRAARAEPQLERVFHICQDRNTSAAFLFGATSRAFAFWLDVICMLYIASVVLSFLVIGDDIISGSVGLAITQVLNLVGMCNWGLRQTAELENQMTSVERIAEYCRLVPEPDLAPWTGTGKAEPPPEPDWPVNPSIVFREVSLRYAPTADPVLRQLDFEIKPKERVGIVGRTGAGKSSIIQALFRLTPANAGDGSIEIDGVNIGTVPLRRCRGRISIIPQDPVIFSGSLRNNLDPFGRLPDEQLWRALEQVELKNMVETCAGGLQTAMAEGGTNFSMGQRQLLCLARAILKRSNILILDEATASVDPRTDELIQRTIRAEFRDCTILTVAHRLHTVLDSDRVLVMQAGRVLEFDTPANLLGHPDGHFRRMFDESGLDLGKHSATTGRAPQSTL